MAKVRIHHLAKELDISNAELISILRELGVEVKSHSSTVDEEVVDFVRELVYEQKGKKTDQLVVLPRHPITVIELSERFHIDIGTITRTLMVLGIPVAPNQPLDLEIVIRLMKELGYEFTFEKEEAKREMATEILKEKEPEKEIQPPSPPPPVQPEHLQPRPPIVTVMGHVDHGKTTLLDTIRKTNIADQEFGQITQHIGAYEVEHKDYKIVFIDTPGHEAFTALRMRGAMVTDIVVLVVAADDGVMPQTLEAIKHAKAAGVPIVVAINKIDRPNANPDRVKAQLAEHGLIPDEWGGETPCVNISALRGDNINELLDMILFVAELVGIKADPNAPERGYILEAKMDPRRGPITTVIVKQGILRKGDFVAAGITYGRVRSMTNWKGEELTEAPPSTPVSVLGLEDLPEAGDELIVLPSLHAAKDLAEQRKEMKRQQFLSSTKRLDLEEFFQRRHVETTKYLNLILKADVQGSLDAIVYSLERIEHPEVKLNFIHKGIGDISESDIMLAASFNTIIIGFNVKVDQSGRQALQRERVKVCIHRIIYELLNDVKKYIVSLLEPIYREEILGTAEVKATFKITQIGTVAGCLVLQGRLAVNSFCRVIRNEQVFATTRIVSLHHFAEDRTEILQGMECGVALENFTNYQIGDLIEAFQVTEIPRQLSEIREKPSTELAVTK